MAYSMLDGPDIGSYGTGYDDYSSGMMGQSQPQRPSFLQAFQGGVQQNAGKKKNPILAGLAGQAGGGGIMGAIGKGAAFML